MAARETTAEGMPGRYASALFELAREAGQLDALGRDLDRFAALLDESQDLVRAVRSPVFSAEEQRAAMAAVLEKAGIAGLAANFIGLVAQNRRLFAIRDMIKAYRQLLALHRGEIAAQVTAAEALSVGQLNNLKDALKSVVGRDVQLESRIDPALLGGLIVKIGSRMVDNSLRTKLQHLKVAMKGVA